MRASGTAAGDAITEEIIRKATIHDRSDVHDAVRHVGGEGKGTIEDSKEGSMKRTVRVASLVRWTTVVMHTAFVVSVCCCPAPSTITRSERIWTRGVEAILMLVDLPVTLLTFLPALALWRKQPRPHNASGSVPRGFRGLGWPPMVLDRKPSSPYDLRVSDHRERRIKATWRLGGSEPRSVGALRCSRGAGVCNGLIHRPEAPIRHRPWCSTGNRRIFANPLSFPR